MKTSSTSGKSSSVSNNFLPPKPLNWAKVASSLEASSKELVATAGGDFAGVSSVIVITGASMLMQLAKAIREGLK